MNTILQVLRVLAFIATTSGFTIPNKQFYRNSLQLSASCGNKDEPVDGTRKSILSLPFCLATILNSGDASWAIDVSGLPVEGATKRELTSQLKSYDGSGTTRVKEIRANEQVDRFDPDPPAFKNDDSQRQVATWAYRANPGFPPNIARVGPIGTLSRYRDSLVGPFNKGTIGVQFEFPADWLQLDRASGGIQFVDQRNGAKLYVFRAVLPEQMNLESLPKSAMGNLIFDQAGSFIKSGQTIEDFKVASSKILSDCPAGTCSTRRRFKLKYASLTGNGVRVERRALVDAYEVSGNIYMLMTSSNAVKFEQEDSMERQTVEKIVDSFQVGT